MDKDEAEIVVLLRESVRQQRMWLGVVVVGVIIGAIIMVAMFPGLRLSGPLALTGVGTALGILITAPQRKMLAELGLSREQAIELLSRADRVGLTLEERKARQGRSRETWRLVTTVSTIIAVIAIVYVASQAGNTVDDNAPESATSALFPLALFGGAVAGITAITGFIQLSTFPPVDHAAAVERATTTEDDQAGQDDQIAP
ncbi:hypothetical protein [Tessaracoccus caeni]|uniref:hypothetical protein n=1 Tax=Tessaracoccus caeni TaxID=3031239 RepID=UPI0023DC91EF|nr:hypothetical protein [Tessaracoccus caeni]MDF1488842.1 hypothetical protein [Tessaracoccus caeni]